MATRGVILLHLRRGDKRLSLYQAPCKVATTLPGRLRVCIISFRNIGRKRTVKIIYRKDQNGNPSKKDRGRDDQEKVDEILDKIARSGYDSLTKDEKDFLFNYSKK